MRRSALLIGAANLFFLNTKFTPELLKCHCGHVVRHIQMKIKMEQTFLFQKFGQSRAVDERELHGVK